MANCFPLLGIKAYVDVRSKHANHSSAVADELKKLGAIVYDKLLPTVTHIIFKDGSKVTEAKATKFGAHIVSVNWVDSCKTSNERVAEYLYSMGSGSSTGKKKQRSMQPKDFQEELQHVTDRLAKVKKRRSGIHIPSPLNIVADRINVNDYLQAPRTPPAMQKRIDQLREKQASSCKTPAETTPARALQPINTNTLGNSPELAPFQTERGSRVIVPMSVSKSASRPGADHVVPETPFHWNVKKSQPVFTTPPDQNNLRLRTNLSSVMDVGKEPTASGVNLSSDSLSPLLGWDQTIDSFLNDKIENSQMLSPERSTNETPNSVNKEIPIPSTTSLEQENDAESDDKLPSLEQLSARSNSPRPVVGNNGSERGGDPPFLNDSCPKRKFVPPYKSQDSARLSTWPEAEIDNSFSLLGELPLASPDLSQPARRLLGGNARKIGFVPPARKTIKDIHNIKTKPKFNHPKSVSDILALHLQVIANKQSETSSPADISADEKNKHANNLSSAFAKLKSNRRSSVIPRESLLDADNNKSTAIASGSRQSLSLAKPCVPGDEQHVARGKSPAQSQQITLVDKQLVKQANQVECAANFLLESYNVRRTYGRKSMAKRLDVCSDASTVIDESICVEKAGVAFRDASESRSLVLTSDLKVSRKLGKESVDISTTSSTDFTKSITDDNKSKPTPSSKRKRSTITSTSSSLLTRGESTSDISLNKECFSSSTTDNKSKPAPSSKRKRSTCASTTSDILLNKHSFPSTTIHCNRLKSTPSPNPSSKRKKSSRASTSSSLLTASESTSDKSLNKHLFTSTTADDNQSRPIPYLKQRRSTRISTFSSLLTTSESASEISLINHSLTSTEDNRNKPTPSSKRKGSTRVSTSSSSLTASESTSDMSLCKRSFTSITTDGSKSKSTSSSKRKGTVNSTGKGQRQTSHQNLSTVNSNSVDSGVESTFVDLSENNISTEQIGKNNQSKLWVDDDGIWAFEAESVPLPANSSANAKAVVAKALPNDTESSKMPKTQTNILSEKMPSVTPVRHLKCLNIGKPIMTQRKLQNMVLTSLHTGDRSTVRSVVKKLGGYHINMHVDNSTTHVVCGDSRRTLNVLKGISQGCWIVSVEWVLACLDADDWVSNEENYLMNESFGGVSLQRRQHIITSKNKLLATVGPIYVCYGTKPPQEELASLIKLNGGKVVKTRRACQLIIGRACDVRIGRAVIKESWVLDCITAQKLLDYKPYKWNASCSSSDNDENDLCNIFDN